MKSAEQFIEDFIDKLNNDEFKIEKEPNIENSKLTDEFIKDKIKQYEGLLKSDLFKKIQNEEKLTLSLKNV